MKCERCGNQLDDTDLFCPKCGKAVFEEYMDDDDIWDEYDREPKAEPEEEPEAELELSKTVQPEQPSKTKDAEESPNEEDNKQEETAKMPQIPKEEPKQKRQTEAKKAERKTNKKTNEKADKTTNKNTTEASGKKSPVGLICACILMVCLLIGVLWGMLTVKQMDKEQATTSTADNSQEQENQASNSTDTTKAEETTKPEEAEESKTKEDESKTEEQEQQPEAKPEEVEQKKQDYFVMVDKDSVDFSQYTKLAVTNAEQSSMSSSDNYDYSANSAVDGDITSSWQEGVDGLGEGTGIKLSLDGTHKIRYIVLYLGNWRSDEMWQKNARPAKLSINLGENQAKDVEFSDEKKAFCLSFDEPVEASFVSLYIEAGYAGSKWNDNCISEVELYE